MYWDYYIMGIILLPAIILAAYAQTKVNTTYTRYSKMIAKSGMTGAEVARLLLDCADLKHIQVVRVQGELTDYYDPKKQVVALSNSVYDNQSVSALGVASHEVGHAIQDKNGYIPFKIRKAIIPVTNFLSSMLWPLVIFGLIFNFGVSVGSTNIGNIFMWSGVGIFGLSVLVNLVTLPVEFNASKRAVKILRSTGIMSEEEIDGTKSVLTAAALTYVAALLVSILSFLRFILVFVMRNRD